MTEQEELDFEMEEDYGDLTGWMPSPYLARARARAASEEASQAAGRKIVIVALDADVAEVYRHDSSVNQALRKLMKAKVANAELPAETELAKAS